MGTGFLATIASIELPDIMCTGALYQQTKIKESKNRLDIEALQNAKCLG